LQLFMDERVGEDELQKVKNKSESARVFGEISTLNKAINLALFELMGDAHWINNEEEKYSAITTDKLQEFAQKTFRKSNCSCLYYRKSE